ncbi:MAG: class I SAM-dependent methyltransferase [Hyphomicrobiaceae bacterium]
MMKSEAATIEDGRAGEHLLRPARIVSGLLASRLAEFTCGHLTVSLPSGLSVVQAGHREGPRAHISVRRWRALLRLLAEGDIGFAAGYIEGDWTTDNLPAVIEYGMANEKALTKSANGIPAALALNRLRHLARRNSRKGSRRNIAAHYDLGNAFYARWLDPGMQYSSALYEESGESLSVAQERKLAKVVELLGLGGSEHILEIGCGWGAVAERLAADHGCHVNGLTLSREQADYARRRLAAAGLASRAKIEIRDYRDIVSTYDRIVSIEMFEAVGEPYWPLYFETLARSLKDNGCAVLQVITIGESSFEAYRKRPDFIQKYIFPGGMLPTKAALHRLAEDAGFAVTHQLSFGLSYAETLAAWRDAFHRNWTEIEPLGFDERFRRMWDYYLCYCETGFRHDTIDVGLYKLEKCAPASQAEPKVHRASCENAHPYRSDR